MGINPTVHVLDEDPRGKDLERVLIRLLGTSSAESTSSMKRRLTVGRLTKPLWFILLVTMAYIAKLCPPPISPPPSPSADFTMPRPWRWIQLFETPSPPFYSPSSHFSPQRHFYLAVDRHQFKMETLMDLLGWRVGVRGCLLWSAAAHVTSSTPLALPSPTSPVSLWLLWTTLIYLIEMVMAHKFYILYLTEMVMARD
ncbi:hypothetical protein ACFX11_039979 [Malus domestica]